MARQTSKGTCSQCGAMFNRSSMTRHLAACVRKHGSSRGRTRHFVIRAEGRYATGYWLYVGMPASETLEILDAFLRTIWLECCGHLSAFTINGQTYSCDPMEEFDDEDMATRLEDVLRPGTPFSYKYDFGSTTHLVLEVVGEWTDKRPPYPARVLARNNPPEIACRDCGKPATLIEAGVGGGTEGCLCEECGRKQEEEIYLLPLVNSPRTGVCAYTGR